MSTLTLDSSSDTDSESESTSSLGNYGDSSDSATSEDLEEELLAEVDHALEDMPDLWPAGYPDSDEEDSEDEDSDTEEDSGDEANDEEMSDTEELAIGSQVARFVQHTIEEMYSRRYKESRDKPIN